MREKGETGAEEEEEEEEEDEEPKSAFYHDANIPKARTLQPGG